MKLTRILFNSLLLIGLMLGCNSGDQSNEAADSLFAQRPANASMADANSLEIISPDSFWGISPGDEMAIHDTELIKGQMVNSKGDFTVYLILNEQGGKVGYLMPDPGDTTKVGDITITSANPETQEGMKVGMTLGDLFDRYRNLEIHGSETDGRTTASKGQLAFRIDAENRTYEIDPRKIPLDTRITEILIKPSSAK